MIALFGAALVLAAIAWRQQQIAPPVGKRHPLVGQSYLPKELPPLTAKERVREQDLQGNVVLVNFWGWWCGPCKVEFPHLMELEQSLRGKPDFRFISVACGPGPSEENDLELHDKTAAFLSERRAEIPTYVDPQFTEQQRLAAMTGSESFGIPLTVVIGRDGKIRGLWPGYHQGDELDIRAVIDVALK